MKYLRSSDWGVKSFFITIFPGLGSNDTMEIRFKIITVLDNQIQITSKLELLIFEKA